MSNQVHGWYDFSLAQIASDSYLDNLDEEDFDIFNPDDVRVRLRNGANYYETKIFQNNIETDNLSATRMTEVMIDDFQDTWSIVDHQENTNSGFSATLLRHKITGEYTLSFRSTESKDVKDGGDVVRDSSSGANGQIKDKAFAYGQILDMETYYKNLISTGMLPVNSKINVTGYSLGGHLAQVFTLLHYDEIKQTTVFNGAGFGDFPDLKGNNSREIYSRRIRELIDLTTNIMDSPLSHVDEMPDLLFEQVLDQARKTPVFNRVLLTHVPDIINGVHGTKSIAEKTRILQVYKLIHDNFDSFQLDNIYINPLFNLAVEVVSNDLVPSQTVALKELLVPDVFEWGRDRINPDSKITNLFGHAIPGDNRVLGEFVAGSGQIFGSFLPIFIEEQPVFKYAQSTEFSDQLLRSFGPGHSISLLVDTLAVMDIFSRIDPLLSRVDLNQIFALSSNSRRSTVVDDLLGHLPSSPVLSKAEGDSLRITLDSLGKFLFNDNWAETPVHYESGDFANLEYRNEYYLQIRKIRDELLDKNKNLKAEYINYGIKVVNLNSIDESEIIENAKVSVEYRYALRELNPIVITGDPSLYEIHNQNGELDRDNFSNNYIKDRTAFLKWKNFYSINNIDSLGFVPSGEYIDETRGLDFGAGPVPGEPDGLILFGKNQNATDKHEFLRGTGKQDHIYGGLGNDTLIGYDGNKNSLDTGDLEGDYLEGGRGDDTLWHADEDDYSEDNSVDILNGGLGHDTYHVGFGDEITDSNESNGNKEGHVFYQNRHFTGGSLLAGTTDIYKEGIIRYQWSGIAGDTLSVTVKTGEAPILIHDFNNGDLGIQLLTSPPDKLLGSIQDDNFGTDSAGNTYSISAGSFSEFPNENTQYFSEPVRHIQGLGGADTIQIDADIPKQVIFGDSSFTAPDSDGNDFISVDRDSVENDVIHTDTLHGSYIWGEGGDDFVSGSNRDDYLNGGTGHDFIKANANNDQIFGDDGNDWLEGGLHNDQLYGNNDNDWLFGGAGQDVLNGGHGNDRLWGDAGDAIYYRNETGTFWQGQQELINPIEVPPDALAPEIVKDVPSYLGASDVLEGGTGNDILYGGVAGDFLYGNDDHDILQGEGGDDFLYGGSGKDILWGDKDPDSYEADHAPATKQGHIFRKHSDRKDVAGNDLLDGGRENDILKGGEGNDTYIFSYGYGTDVIDDLAGFDTINLTGGITHEEVKFQKNYSDLVISLSRDGAETEDSLIVTDWFAGRVVEQVKFDSATVLSTQDILERVQGKDIPQFNNLSVIPHSDQNSYITLATEAVDIATDGDRHGQIYGLGGDDHLAGGRGNDRLFGGTGHDELQGNDGDDVLIGESGRDLLFGQAGDDHLFGGTGDDELQGGAGNDQLAGEAGDDNLTGGFGDDTYLFNRHDGDDYILDDGGLADSIQFGEGISRDDVSLALSGDNLIINLLQNGQQTGDKITIVGWFDTETNVESFHLNDGTHWNNADILQLLPDEAKLLDGEITPGGSGATSYLFKPDSDLVNGFEMTIVDAGGYDNLQFMQTTEYVNGEDNRHATPQIITTERQGNDILLDVSVVSEIDSIPNASGQIRIVDFYTADGFIEIIELGATRVNSPNTPPQLMGSLPDQIIELGQDYFFQIPQAIFTDNNFDYLTYSARRESGSELPPWLSIDPETGVLSGTPDMNDGEILNLIINVTDSKGLSASTEFELNVGNLNVAPILGDDIIDQTTIEGETFSYTLPTTSFIDKNLYETLTISISPLNDSELPDWLIYDAGSQTLSGIPTSDDVGTVILNVSASDKAGLSVSDYLLVTVDYLNDAPTLNIMPDNQSGIEQQSFQFTLSPETFSDTDSIHGDFLTYSASQVDGSPLPGWMIFDPENLNFSGRPVGLSADTHFELRVTATDSLGLSRYADFTFDAMNSDSAVDWLVPRDVLPLVSNSPKPNNSVTELLSDGTYVVVWQSLDQGNNRADIYAQRFDSTGAALSSVFQINTSPQRERSQPHVAALQGGGFVVTWDSDANPSGSFQGAGEVLAQRFDNEGNFSGSEFRVNSVYSGTQAKSSVTSLSNGGFVVTWFSEYASQNINSTEYGSGDRGLFAQRYSENGTPVGSEFRISEPLSTTFTATSVAGLNDGGFVVVWDEPDVSSLGIYAQRVTANGTLAGSVFPVNSTVVDEQSEPSVTGLADGGFIIVWKSHTQDGDQGGIYGQRYDVSGQLVGTEIHISSHSAGSQSMPSVIAREDGGFVVSWHSELTDQNMPTGRMSGGIYSQIFDVDGNRVTDELQLHSLPPGLDSSPSTIAFQDGSLAYVWISNEEGSAFIQSRRLDNIANTGIGVNLDFSSADISVYRQFNLALSEHVFIDRDLKYGDKHTYSATLVDGGALPDWLSFDTETGRLSGLPLFDQIGSIGIKLSATDTAGEKAEHVFDLNIAPAPTIDSVADTDAAHLLTTAFNDELQPEVVNLLNGTRVLIHESSEGIYAQLYTVEGIPLGEAFRVDTGPYHATAASIVELSTGGFVISWVTDNTVTGRKYAADGTALTEPFEIFTSPLATQLGETSLTVLADGGFLVGWLARETSSALRHISLQRFTANEIPHSSGQELLVASGELNLSTPLTAELMDGRFVTVWSDSTAIYAKTFDRNLLPLGGTNQINDITGGQQITPDILSLPDGGYLIVWTGDNGSGDEDIYARRFSANGTAYGNAWRVNNFTNGEQRLPSIAATADGGFVIAWASETGINTSEYGAIHSQHFNREGQPTGDLIEVTMEDTYMFSASSIVTDKEGGFEIYWASRDEEWSESSILSRNYSITSQSQNLLPVVSNKIQDRYILEDMPFEFIVSDNVFTDADGDELTIRASLSGGEALPTWLTFDNETRRLRGVPLNHHVGNYTITFTATDTSNDSVSDSFNLNVINQQDAPVAMPDSASIRLDAGVRNILIDVLKNDVDEDIVDMPSSFSLDTVSLRGHKGSVSVIDNRLFFNSGNDFTGLTGDEIETVTIDYTMSDSAGNRSSSTVSIAIHNGEAEVGSIGDDVIQANSNRSYIGLGGSDTYQLSGGSAVTLHGGPDSDRYEFSGDSGRKTIYDLGRGAPGNSTYSPNTAYFYPSSGLSKRNMKLRYGSLLLTFDQSELEIHLKNFDPNDVLNGPRTIDTFIFNEIEYSYEEIVSQGFDLDGTADDDHIVGTNVTDRINGFSGNDHLNGGHGDDTLTGGVGADNLSGGAGNDTYYFNPGDGHDLISDESGLDRIVFGAGISSAHVVSEQSGNDLKLSLHTDDSMTIKDWYLSSDRKIESFIFTGDNLRQIDSMVIETMGANHMPSVKNFGILNQIVAEDVTYTFMIPEESFIDPDLNDSIEYTASLASGEALPDWLDFNRSTQTFSGTPDNSQVGLFSIRVTATDRQGLSVNDEFSLTVKNTNDAPELAGANIDDLIVAQDTPLSLTIPMNTFSDPDIIHGDSLSYSAKLSDNLPLPAWLSFNQTDRIFTGTPGASDLGTVDIRLTATDTHGLSTDDIFSLTVRSYSYGDGDPSGYDGDDLVDAGEGGNQHHGNNGNDAPADSSGDESQISSTEDESLTAGSGNDSLDASSGIDTQLGEQIDDSIDGGNDPDVLAGADGDPLGYYADDLADAEEGSNQHHGNHGNDVSTDSSGDESQIGSTGDDSLTAGTGNNDTSSIDTQLVEQGDLMIGPSDNEILPEAHGYDQIQGGGGNVAGEVNNENLWFWQQGLDLSIDLADAQDWLTNDSKYTSSANDDGYSQMESQLEQLVDAMAVFDVEATAHLNVSQGQYESDPAVLAANWANS